MRSIRSNEYSFERTIGDRLVNFSTSDLFELQVVHVDEHSVFDVISLRDDAPTCIARLLFRRTVIYACSIIVA